MVGNSRLSRAYCPACKRDHSNASNVAANYSPTKAGYMWLATERAEKKAADRGR